MITTSILLNGRMTFGTFFSVGRDPIRGLRVVLTFLQPFLDQNTWAWTVIVESATETKRVSTLTDHRRYDLVKLPLCDRTIDRVLAFGCRTPFHIILVIDVSSSKKNSISSSIPTQLRLPSYSRVVSLSPSL